MLKYHLVFGLSLLLLIPFNPAFSQEFSDNAPTLSVSLTSDDPFVYRDSEGYTVVVGEVENNNQLTSVSNVRIQVTFFDDFNTSPIYVTEGQTTLEVIPPNGLSTYSVRSPVPDPDIAHASVSVLNFDSSNSKEKLLEIFSTEVLLDTSLRFSGVLKNGDAPSPDTRVHLAFYDAFEPPRILSVSTLELGDISPNTKTHFDFNEKIDTRSVGFHLFAESDISHSEIVDIVMPPPQTLTSLVKITDVSVKDKNGNRLSEINLGSSVNIESKTIVEFAESQVSPETPYTYYVQVKESGTSPYVVYLEKYDGRFVGGGDDSQIIDWMPDESGLFFIETFVWDRNNIPLSEQGPFVLVVVR